MLPNKLSNRGVIKSAAVLLYGKWNMCFGFGGFVWLWGLFCLFGRGEKGNEMDWGPVPRAKGCGVRVLVLLTLWLSVAKKRWFPFFFILRRGRCMARSLSTWMCSPWCWGNYKMMMFASPLVPGKVRICFTVAQLLPWICCPGAGASLALAANLCQWLLHPHAP